MALRILAIVAGRTFSPFIKCSIVRRETPLSLTARNDQGEQQPKSAAPQTDMLAQRKGGLQDERIGQQGEKTAGIRGRVEKVRVLAGGMSGADEPCLQQRIVGSERKERQPDRDGEQSDQPERRPSAGRIAPTRSDRQGQRQPCGDK